MDSELRRKISYSVASVIILAGDLGIVVFRYYEMVAPIPPFDSLQKIPADGMRVNPPVA